MKGIMNNTIVRDSIANVKVSIITPCLNSEKTIRQTIDCVLNQTYSNIEYIIIDGGSTDNTMEIIEEYLPLFNGRLKYVSEKDGGIYEAMNKGIRQAEGEIIGIINSDDWYERNAIENVVKCFANCYADVVYGKILKVTESGEKETYPIQDLCTIWYQMAIAHPAVFIKKSVYNQYGLFNEKYKISADYELLLRFYSQGLRFEFLDVVLTNFRVGGASQVDTIIGWQEGYAIAFQYVDQCPYKEKIIPVLKENYGFFLLENILKKKPSVFGNMLKDFFGRDLQEIVIFGAGDWGKKCYTALAQTDIFVKYFLDNNENESKVFDGKKVLRPSNIKCGDAYVLIAVRHYDNEIMLQLKSLHITRVVSIKQIVQRYLSNTGVM